MSSLLCILTCLMYFVSFGGSIGGITLSRVILIVSAFVRIDRDLLRRAVEISRRAAPLLAFAAIHRQLHGVTI